ncbi:MAG: SpoIIE family protein phosphatase, partial [Bacteroidia bacterium]|nr:SpoIIE family protein phosphatase [Bacteroidia bacterium]
MKKINYFIFNLLALFVFQSAYAVNEDSIFVKINALTNSKDKVDLFYKTLTKSDFDKLKSEELIVKFEKLVSAFSEMKDKTYAVLIKGDFYHSKNDDKSAFKYYYEALAQYEKANNSQGRCHVHHKIGMAIREAKNPEKALSHLYESLALAVNNNDKELFGDNHSAIGICFKDLKKFDSSIFHHEIALKTRLEIGNQKDIGNTYNDIGLAYKADKKMEKSLEYILKSLSIREKLNDKRGISGACINIGNTLKRLKRHKEAKEYFDRGIQIARENKYMTFFFNGIGGRAENALMMKDYKTSAEDFLRYNEGQDSMYNVNLKTQLNELEVNYQSEKKDAALLLQGEQIKAKTEQNAKQKALTLASTIALLMALVAVIFIYRSYKQNKRNAQELAAINQVIEEKNREITDSINYAKLIQESLLASKEMLDKNLESYFVLYKPKDIVSGDFYWAAESNNGFLIACVDCTGHGVPGAFMSLIGKENLDKAVSKTNNPGEILSELNKSVKRSLNQNENTKSRDGMDAAVLRIEKNNNGNATVYYAGANRPLYLLKKETSAIEEIKATKNAVGGFTVSEQVFTEHKINVTKGDTLVITTDGYADQFGSDNNKKLTTKRFKDLLNTIKSNSPTEQKNKLETFFNDWKGKNEQLDDLLV